MGVVSRGIKNAFRNTIRTVSITFILALSIAMSLIMLLALKTVQSKIESVKSSIGNTISISPAGVRGFEGGGELLTESDVSELSSINHISKVIKTVTDKLTTDENTNLQSAIEPGSFGERQQKREGGNTQVIIDNGNNRKISMPLTVTGTNELTASAISAEKFDITSGNIFDTNTSDNVALLGSELATKNSLSVGSTFKAYDQDITVVGIFDAGNKFSNSGLVMPIKTLQNLSEQSDQYNSITVQIDSIDNIDDVQTAIKDKLGDKADVVSQQDSAEQAVKPLENIKTISLYSLIGSLVAGSIIIFLTMIMIVRERRREIGVLKAIGSSNINVVSQFTIESLVLTLMSSVVGIIIGIACSNPVLKVLVTNSESSITSGEKIVRQMSPGGGGMMATRIGGGIANAQNALRDIHAVIGLDIVLYGILAAIIIAIIGSAIPAFFIAKVRPAEVMRAE